MASDQAAGQSLADRMQLPQDGQRVDWAEDAQGQLLVSRSDSSLTMADAAVPSQVDGAGRDQNGSSLTEMEMNTALLEPEFDVNVKLNDLQGDPNNPLYSVKDFTELNL